LFQDGFRVVSELFQNRFRIILITETWNLEHETWNHRLRRGRLELET
jgi:hypothetical protein